jgi:hypothetical protein
VRWITNAQPSFGAIGPSHVDPRSGEILDADIAFESLSSRNLRAARSQILPVRSHPGLAFTASGAAPIQAQTQAHWAGLMQAADLQAELGLGRAVAGQAASGHEAEFCDHADQAAEGLAYGLDLLEARGELDPGGPEAEAFVQAYMKDVAMHEVGHTLGLRHNFRASRIYSDAQVSDPEFGRSHALSGSVMEYLPVNLPRPGDKPTAPFQTTLGPYDYWAIEYAYKPVAAELEKSELERIAARSGEPELAFATDEDNFLGVDPESLHFDLGDDPVAFATKRLAIAQDLLKRLEKREFDPGDDFGVLRRSLTYMLRDLARSSGVLARQIGGVRTLRDRANTLRDPLEPVPASRQRAALDALARGLLSPDALAFSAGLQRRLGPDFLEREDALFEGGAMPPTDFVPAQVVLELQTTLLGQLMSDGVAVRLIDSEAKFDRQQPGADAPLRVSELWGRLQREVWGELAAGREIPALRRELQRDHVNRMAALLLNPGRLSRGDTRALLRAQASDLQTRLAAAAKRSDWNEETRAHLRDCGETLREALSARLNRSGL